MEHMAQIKQQTHQAPSAFIHRSGLLQRKCACGGSPGLNDMCEECRSQKLSLQRSKLNSTEPSLLSLYVNMLSSSNQGRVDVAMPGPIQAKPAISQPGDRYEQEADQVAKQVMCMPASENMRNVGSAEYYLPTHVQRLSTQTEEVQRQPKESLLLPAKEGPGHTPTVTPELHTYINSLKGGGQPLPEATRAFMEPRFGYDFSLVRVHTDARATQTAKAVNALAYTVGRNVVFGAGQYSPEIAAGQRLLAHELAHIVQQDQDSLTTHLPSIQRRVKIRGSKEDPTVTSHELDSAERKRFLSRYYSDPNSFTRAKRILEDMAYSRVNYEFDSETDLSREISQRIFTQVAVLAPIRETDAPNRLELPSDLVKGLEEAWKKAFFKEQGYRSLGEKPKMETKLKEQGGILVHKWYGPYGWRPPADPYNRGTSGTFIPNREDVKEEEGEKIAAEGHVHPYYSRTPAGFSGADIRRLVTSKDLISVVRSEQNLYALLVTRESRKLVDAISSEIEQVHEKLLQSNKQFKDLDTQVDAAIREISRRYHLVYYRGQGTTLTKVGASKAP